jgi:hypothetical protein
MKSAVGSFTRRKRTLYFLSRKLSVPQRLSGRFGEEKNLWLLPGIESREEYKQLLWRKFVLRK